ncbi:MAG: MBL fold metallo-hydrolase [Clostridia bacterium]|nr:MBL fold metallo-hydrolase [Clostridia bacterium]
MELKVLKAGYCTQIEKIALSKGRLKKIVFPALFALIKHPEKGVILFDTGYSSHIFRSTGKFPYSFYRKITPIFLKKGESAKEQLAVMGISNDEVKYIILSHFHADHIGGCRDFPNAAFICSKTDYQKLKNKSGFRALRHGFIPSLLPSDFETRVEFLEEKEKAPLPIKNSVFDDGYDLLNDKSIFGIPLPGHTGGQFGIMLKVPEGCFFFVSDACWLSDTYQKLIFPNKIAKLIIEDDKKYRENILKLYRLSKEDPFLKVIPSHCMSVFDPGLYSK